MFVKASYLQSARSGRVRHKEEPSIRFKARTSKEELWSKVWVKVPVTLKGYDQKLRNKETCTLANWHFLLKVGNIPFADTPVHYRNL